MHVFSEKKTTHWRVKGVDNSFLVKNKDCYNEDMKNYPYPPLSSYRSQKLVEVMPENRILFFDEILKYGWCLKKMDSVFYACLYSKDLRKIIWSAENKEKDALYEIARKQLEMLYGGGDYEGE